jgi:hypothetical protein
MAAQRATAARPRSMPGACAPSSFMRAMLPRCSASSRAIPSTSSTPPGQGPAEDEALQEPHDVPPPDTAFGRQWLLGFVDETGELVAMANCVNARLRVWLDVGGSTRTATTRRSTARHLRTAVIYYSAVTSALPLFSRRLLIRTSSRVWPLPALNEETPAVQALLL